MIENDFSRSLDFIKSPAQAGQQARLLPFSLQTFIAIFVLCAIATVLVSEALSAVMPDLMQDFGAPANTTAFEQQVYDAIAVYAALFRGNPILVAIISTIVSLISSILLFVVGRNFSPQVDFLGTLSALARIEIVWTFFTVALQAVAIVFWSVSEVLGSSFSNLVAIVGFVLFVVKLHVIKGIFEFESLGKAAMIWFLMLLCLIGVGFFISLIITMFSL